MNDNPLVSVVICTYNQEKYITQTLDSVLAQKTEFPVEIILADDCSSDSTPDICSQYAGMYPDRIRYVRNSRNKGLIRNYFDSVMMARGKYVADLAGDDIWVDPNKLADQVKVMERDGSILMCHTAWRMFDDAGRITVPGNFYMPGKVEIARGSDVLLDLLRHDKKKYFVHMCSSLYRKDAVAELLDRCPGLFLDPSLPCEDFQLVTMLAAKGNFAYLPSVTLHYRVGHVSVSSVEDPAKVAAFAANVIKLTLAVCDKLNVDRKLLAGYFRFDLQYALMNAFLAGRRDLRDDIAALARSAAAREIGLSLKTKVMLLLTSSRFAWRPARALYRAIKH